MKPYQKAQAVPLQGLEDRRRRLTDEQKEEMRRIYAKGGIGTRRLGKMFGVSRSLAVIVVNPERAQKVRDRIAAHWREYYKKYGKEYHAAAMRRTRNYKYKIYKGTEDAPKEN